MSKEFLQIKQGRACEMHPGCGAWEIASDSQAEKLVDAIMDWIDCAWQGNPPSRQYVEHAIREFFPEWEVENG